MSSSFSSWAEQNWEDGENMEQSKAKQSLMRCPDLSKTLIFEKFIDWKMQVVLEVNATCIEYFELTDPCIGITCNENASCVTKGNSFECSCKEGFIKTNDATDSSGWFLNWFLPA